MALPYLARGAASMLSEIAHVNIFSSLKFYVTDQVNNRRLISASYDEPFRSTIISRHCLLIGSHIESYCSPLMRFRVA